MKILFDNKLLDASFAAVNASPNYPVENLVDEFLRVRYQSTETTDTITITLAAAVPIDSFYFGYLQDVTAITVTFNLSSSPVGTAGFGDYAGEEFASRHFTQIASVDEVVIELTGSTSSFSVGGVGSGTAIDMPAPDADWEDSFTDNSVVVRSDHGQVQQQYIEPYARYLFMFNGVESTEFSAIKAAAASVGTRPVWVTFFEDSPAVFPPGYYSAVMKSQQRSRHIYRFRFIFEEAR